MNNQILALTSRLVSPPIILLLSVMVSELIAIVAVAYLTRLSHKPKSAQIIVESLDISSS
ncbi:MAG: hypothetical protein ACTMUB_06310 [cyanobacterium endosymbiont of Rhopalodia musculus]